MHFLNNEKKTIKYTDRNEKNHVSSGAGILSLDISSSKEIYLISNTANKPNLNTYFKELFEKAILDWSKIYLSPHLATIGTTLHSIQHKIVNIVLFLNRKP